MTSKNRAAEKLMANKYGERAYEAMPNWVKVRNRVEERLYQSAKKRQDWMAPAITASVSSAVCTLAIYLYRSVS